MVHLNMTKIPFDKFKVRQAVSHAISRAQVAAFMGSSLAEPIYSAAMAPPAAGAMTKEDAKKAGSCSRIISTWPRLSWLRWVCPTVLKRRFHLRAGRRQTECDGARGPDPAPESCGRCADHAAEIRLPDEGLAQNFSQPGFRWFFGKMFDKIRQIGKFPLVHVSEFNSVIISDSPYLFTWQFDPNVIH